MAKGKGNPNGIAIPVYLDTESFKEQIAKLPADIEKFLGTGGAVNVDVNVANAIKKIDALYKIASENITLKFKYDVADVKDQRIIDNRKKEMERELRDVTAAASQAINKIAPEGMPIRLRYEVRQKELETSLNRSKDSVTDFGDKLKGLMQLPKLDIDISGAEQSLKLLGIKIKTTSAYIDKLTEKQNNAVATLTKHGIKFDANNRLIDGQELKSKYAQKRDTFEEMKKNLPSQRDELSARLKEIKAQRGVITNQFLKEYYQPQEQKIINESRKRLGQNYAALGNKKSELAQLNSAPTFTPEPEAVKQKRARLEQEIAGLKSDIAQAERMIPGAQALLDSKLNTVREKYRLQLDQLTREENDTNKKLQKITESIPKVERIIGTLNQKVNEFDTARKMFESSTSKIDTLSKQRTKDFDAKENQSTRVSELKAQRDKLVPPEKTPEALKKSPEIQPVLSRIREIEQNIKFISTMNDGAATALKSLKEKVKQAEKTPTANDISKVEQSLTSLQAKNQMLDKAMTDIAKKADSLGKLKSWDYVQNIKNNLEKQIAALQSQPAHNVSNYKKTSETVLNNSKAIADQYYEKAKLHKQMIGVDYSEGLASSFKHFGAMLSSTIKGAWADGVQGITKRLESSKYPKSDLIDNFVNALGHLKFSDLPNINDVYKKSLGAVSPIVQRLQSDFVGIVDSTQSFGTAVSKAFELVGNTRSLEKATEGLTGLKKSFAVAGVAVEAGVRIFSAGAVALLGFENTLESFARPALEAQNSLYIMSLGMHSTIDDMKQLSVITQVAGVNMNSVQTALRRVNAQLAKTSEGSKLAKDTLKHYGAELFDKNGNMKQGMAQLDEIAKAYQNAMVQGRGAEFRYRVGGRYWDNDFVALISDYAANKDAMYKIVKSNLADPKLAYSVRGSMYGLEAQQKQMWTSFSSAFMPVVEHVAPQMKQRFAELTKIIEQNSEGIKGFGFVLGEAIVSLSEFGTSAVKWASEMFRLLDLGRGERIASQVIADKQKEINDSADEILKVQRDSGGGVLKSDNKALYTLMVEQKLPKELMEQIKLYREIFSQKGLTVAQKRNSGLGMVITAEEINLEKRQKELAKDFGDELLKLAKAASTAEKVLNRFGEVDPEKVVDQLERALAGKSTALGDDFLDPNTVKKLQSDAQTFAIEYTKKNYDSEQVKEYETYRRLQDEFYLLKKERSLRQNGVDTDEYIEWIKGLNFDDRVKLRKAKKDEEAGRFNKLQTMRGRVEDMLDDIETVQEEYLRKVAEGVAGAANRIKNEKDSNENENSAVLSEAYEDLVKKAEKFEETNKNLQYDLKYGADEYTKSIAKLNEEYEKNLDILLKQRQVTLEKYRKSGSDVDLAEAEKNLELYRENYQLQKAIADQKHNDEFKKIEEETAKMQFDSTHTEFEKQMRDIEELTKAQFKKAKTAEDVAKIIANAAQKETKAFEDEIDKMRGKFRSVEEEIFRLTHSHYEYEQMKILREATDNIKNAKTEREAERYRLLARLKLGELQRNVKAEDLKRPNNRPVQDFDYSTLEDVDYEVGQDLKAHYDSLEKPKYIDKKPGDFPEVQENIKAFSDLFKFLDAKVLKSAFYILDGNVRKSAVAAQEKAKADSDAATAVEAASNTVKNSSQNVREEFGKLAEAAEGLGFNVSGFFKKTADDRNENGSGNVPSNKKETAPSITPTKGMPTKTIEPPTQPVQQPKSTDDVATKLKETAQKIAGKEPTNTKWFDSISRRIIELTRVVGGIAQDINKQKSQPPQINVNPTINLNLSGSYILTQEMVNQLADDATEQVANGVIDAVTRATNNLRI